MSEQHTPGPWRIHDEGNGDYAIRAFQGPIQVQPARAFGLKDGRLIAAAPDLLAALKAQNDPYLEPHERAEMKRAALAKVRGE